MPNNTLETMNQHIYITNSEEIKEGDWFHLDMSDNDRPDEIHQMGTNKRSKTGGINFSEPNSWTRSCKKIILTTDQDLIKDGVQPIDDEFLEWFVNNPNREWVEVIYDKDAFPYGVETAKEYGWYKIIIPQEEPKIDSIFNEANVRFSETLDKLSDNSLKQETTFEEDEIIDISDHDGIGNAVDNLNDEPPQETLEEAAERYVEQITTIEFGKPHNAPHRVKTFIDGAKWQAEKMYSKENIINFAEFCRRYDTDCLLKNIIDVKNTLELFEQFKKK
jgi:hypothetical protein